jgi:epoxyqueuosine reductase
MPPLPRADAERLRAAAYGLGFDLVGLTTLGPVGTAPQFAEWIAAGRQGSMDYLARGATLREDSTRPEPGMVSAVVVAMDYGGREPSGPVARYARGDDYHDVMRTRLRRLHAELETIVGAPVPARPYVDTGPILERDLARQAGLGWFGKNTMLIHPGRGSFFFLGALFVGLELPADAPFATDHCGRCTRCLDACPTDALVAPRQLDATRCLSYWTIEHRGDIPEAFQAPLREHALLYGCDICQDVCPWNVKFARPLPAGSPYAARPLLADADATTLAQRLLAMDDAAYAEAFRGSAMKRAKRAGLQRNARVLLGEPSGPVAEPHTPA